MNKSPFGAISFRACSKDWTLKFGHIAKVKVEKAFNIGFGAAVQAAFPGITADSMDDPDAFNEALKNIRFEHIGTLFHCGLVEPVSEDELGDLIDELGYDKVGSLIGEAFSEAAPRDTGKKGAAANASAGE